MSCRRQRPESAPPEELPAVPPSRKEKKKIDLNTATAEELETLPGIGAERARNIIADREANGTFRIVEDLTTVCPASGRVSWRPAGRCDCIEGRSPMRILVVDDEKVLVKGIKFNLQSEGYQVEDHPDGRPLWSWPAAGPSISSSWT